jgi:hypothetical protein
MGLHDRPANKHQRGEAKMTQTVLPFKLEITRDTITSHAGLALVGEFIHALGLPQKLDELLPAAGSGAGYAPSEFVLPLLLMLHGGGRALEDLRQLREDAGLRELLGWERMPSTDATGDWLRRMGGGAGFSNSGAVSRYLMEQGLRVEKRTEYTLDLDATQIVAEKQTAAWTYKGERGYMPLVGHLAQNGLVVGEEFRAGNESPGARNLEFIKYCESQMPAGKWIQEVRADSAAYQAEVFNYCEATEKSFAIGADLDSAVRAAIAAIPEADWQPYQGGYLAETVHSMEKTKRAFRLVVIRRPVQGKLFGEEDPRERYTAIASNREETAAQTVAWYNQRGEASENRLKELKLGFGMERMPCGEQEANAMFFRLGVWAYNLFVLFKRGVLPQEWGRHQVQTVRWRLYQTAGKVVDHARRCRLRVTRLIYRLFAEVRVRCWELQAAVP